MNRGRIYLRIGKPAEALKDYDRANYLKPENPDPYYMRAQCYLMMGQKPKAQQEAEEARKRGAQLDPAFLQSLR
jgi:tetratricopeptide (TPR) repeat protein